MCGRRLSCQNVPHVATLRLHQSRVEVLPWTSSIRSVLIISLDNEAITAVENLQLYAIEIFSPQWSRFFDGGAGKTLLKLITFYDFLSISRDDVIGGTIRFTINLLFMCWRPSSNIELFTMRPTVKPSIDISSNNGSCSFTVSSAYEKFHA